MLCGHARLLLEREHVVAQSCHNAVGGLRRTPLVRAALYLSNKKIRTPASPVAAGRPHLNQGLLVTKEIPRSGYFSPGLKGDCSASVIFAMCWAPYRFEPANVVILWLGLISYAKMPVMTPNANTPNVMLVTPMKVYFMSKVPAQAVACHAWGRQVCQGSGSLNGSE